MPIVGNLACYSSLNPPPTHTRTHAGTYARRHARTHTFTHTHIHTIVSHGEHGAEYINIEIEKSRYKPDWTFCVSQSILPLVYSTHLSSRQQTNVNISKKTYFSLSVSVLSVI